MDALRGSNRPAISGYPGDPIDDLASRVDPSDVLWEDVAPIDALPFPVDTPGGWRDGLDGVDDVDAFDATAATGIDVPFWLDSAAPASLGSTAFFQMDDGVDLVPADDVGGLDATFDVGLEGGLRDTLSASPRFLTADSLDVGDAFEDVDFAAASQALGFAAMIGADGTEPLAEVDDMADLAWADVAFQADDAVDFDAQLDADTPFAGYAAAGALASDLDGADDLPADDFVGPALPFFARDPLSAFNLDDVDFEPPGAEVGLVGSSDDAFFADGVDFEV
jgi:hypothetical protein